MSKRKTTDEFIYDATIIHGNRYDYTLVNYKSAREYVEIICKDHGIFKQFPYNHLNHQGCPKCGGTKLKTSEDFIVDAIKLHGDRYNYSLVNYKHSKTKVNIICIKHGLFKQLPNEHLSGKGCPKCSGRNYSIEEFVRHSNIIHNNKYDYSKSIMLGKTFKIDIICKTHGLFKQLVRKHLNGQGCPKCLVSKGEDRILRILNEFDIKCKTQFGFQGCRRVHKLLFDFYLPDYNICIEYDGIQHYQAIEKFGGQVEFDKIKESDNIKNTYCIDNGIRLIRIPYWDFDNIYTILDNNLT